MGLTQIFTPVVVIVDGRVVNIHCFWHNLGFRSAHFQRSVVVERVIDLEDARVGSRRDDELLLFKEFLGLCVVSGLDELWETIV